MEGNCRESSRGCIWRSVIIIFVTVGTAHFDPLIEKMDELAKTGELNEPIVGQIGRGIYIPKHFRYFRFLKSLNAAYDKATVIVSTAGAGTTMECVTRGLKLVVVENMRTDPRIDDVSRANYASIGTEAYVRVPFLRDGISLGALFFKYSMQS